MPRGRLFVTVDASNGKAGDEKYNRKKALNRQEFLQCIVHMACMRYVQPGEVVDVSDAVHYLLSEVAGRGSDSARRPTASHCAQSPLAA